MLELIETSDRARARLRGGGRLRRRLLRRPVLAGLRRRSPGSGSRTWSRPRTPIRAASATRATSPCGRATSRPSRSPRPGRHRGVAADPAGTWSARRWPGKYLGDEFDIHGGGLDLRFPHHENELAQSTAAGQRFARFWMHNAWVTAAGEKMSKSLGNGALVSEVVQALPGPGRALLSGPAALPLGHRVLRHVAGRGDRGAGPDRQLRRPGGRAGGPARGLACRPRS